MLVEVFVLSSVLAASSQRCGVGTRTFSLGSDCGAITASASKEPSLLYSATIEEAVAKDLSLISEVCYVCVDRADRNLLVWIAVDQPDEATREKVFQKQFDLIDGFPEVAFDFNLVGSRGRNPKDFATEAKVVYTRP